MSISFYSSLKFDLCLNSCPKDVKESLHHHSCADRRKGMSSIINQGSSFKVASTFQLLILVLYPTMPHQRLASKKAAASWSKCEIFSQITAVLNHRNNTKGVNNHCMIGINSGPGRRRYLGEANGAITIRWDTNLLTLFVIMEQGSQDTFDVLPTWYVPPSL